MEKKKKIYHQTKQTDCQTLENYQIRESNSKKI